MARQRADNERPVVEELHFRSDNAFLCWLLNRRTKTIRVIDFRAGALPAKRLFIQSVAHREGIDKVIILVEKDEVSSWTRVGFVREGTVPGFYKRSDGHLVGCVIGDKTASIEVDDQGQRLADRTVNAAKKAAKELARSHVALRGVDMSVAAQARDQMWHRGHGLGSFDPFGRDALRLFLDVVPKRGKANYLSAEFQDCFGHSLIEVLRSPRSESDVVAVVEGLRSFSDELRRRGIVSAFGFAPSEDVALSTAYVGSGFRKTGLLARGLQVGGKRSDAILWSKKLANPGEPDELS